MNTDESQRKKRVKLQCMGCDEKFTRNIIECDGIALCEECRQSQFHEFTVDEKGRSSSGAASSSSSAKVSTHGPVEKVKKKKSSSPPGASKAESRSIVSSKSAGKKNRTGLGLPSITKPKQQSTTVNRKKRISHSDNNQRTIKDKDRDRDSEIGNDSEMCIVDSYPNCVPHKALCAEAGSIMAQLLELAPPMIRGLWEDGNMPV